MKLIFFLLLLSSSALAETTYTKDAQPIFKNRCSRCHDYIPGKNWAKYEDAFANKDKIKTKMIDKSMPPDTSIPQEERDTLIKWVEEGGKK